MFMTISDEDNVRVFVDISEAIATIATSAYVGGLHYFELKVGKSSSQVK